MLIVEEGEYYLLVVEVKTDKKSGKFTLSQVGLTKEVLNTVGMLVIIKNITLAEK